MTQDDKRQFRRFGMDLDAKVAVNSSENDQSAMNLPVKDISATGIFLEMEQPLPLGTEVEINISLPVIELKKIENGMASITLNGTVIRKDKQGVAVAFQKNYRIQSAKKS